MAGLSPRTSGRALICGAPTKLVRAGIGPSRFTACGLHLHPATSMNGLVDTTPLYRERPRCPFWVYLAFFVVPAGFFVGLLLIFHAVDPTGYFWSTLYILLAIALLSGALPRFSQRLVTVDESGLHVGRYLVPAAEIESTRPVHGRDLKRLRHQIADTGAAWDSAPGTSVPTAFTSLAGLGIGIDMMFLGLGLMQTEDRRKGMLCSPWQEPALLVETPDLPTKKWLISARDPSRLQAAIERCREATRSTAAEDRRSRGSSDVDFDAAIAALPPDLQPDNDSLDPEGGWLPPARER